MIRQVCCTKFNLVRMSGTAKRSNSMQRNQCWMLGCPYPEKGIGLILILNRSSITNFAFLSSLDMWGQTFPPHFQNSSKKIISHRLRVIKV